MTPEWHEKPWGAGTRVEVYDADMNPIDLGILQNDYHPGGMSTTCWEVVEKNSLMIELDNGGVVQACDYNWIPAEVAEAIRKGHGLQEYVVNVKLEGYDLAMDVVVVARDNDEAVTLATSKEPRYHEEDPYMLLVLTGDDEPMVFCTYPTMADGLKHVKTITAGRWELVEKVGTEGIVLKSSEK